MPEKWIAPFYPTVILIYLAGCSQAADQASTQKTYLRSSDGMEMVYVLSGDFEMGSTDDEIRSAYELCTHFWKNCDEGSYYNEQPIHNVQLDDFWIDRTEVSNAQYQQCVEAGVCGEPECWEGLQFNDPEQPVVCVTWEKARTYCEWVGGRLPTEAEWEYAARGPDRFLYPWGNQFVGTRLNYCDATCGRLRSDPAWNDGQYYSAPVGYYREGASWCEALDLAGNVSVWASDWYGSYNPREGANPAGPTSGSIRVVRGGSWFLTAVEARSAWRTGIPPGAWFDDIGFRCVISDLP